MSEQEQSTVQGSTSPKKFLFEKCKKFLTLKTAAIASGVLVVIIAAVVVKVFFFASPWVIKINSDTITLDEFNAIYYEYHRMASADKTNAEIDKMANDPAEVSRNPLLNKAEFLNQQLSQNLIIYQQAQKSGFTKKADVRALADVQMQNIIADYYFTQTLKDKTAVTDKEVEEAYQQYQSQLKGMPVDEAENRIRAQLQQQKVGMARNKLMREMRDNVQIERDEAVIGKALDTDKSKRPTSGTLVKIKGKSISSTSIDVKEFNTLYYSQNKIMTGAKDDDAVDKLAADPNMLQQTPTLNKKDFLEQLINQHSIYQNVLAANVMKSKELKTRVKMMEEQFFGLYYIKETYAKELEVSNEEVSSEYAKVKAQFPPNVSAEMAEQYIRSRLEQKKLFDKFPEFYQKIRESVLIEKNQKLISSWESKQPASLPLQAPAQK